MSLNDEFARDINLPGWADQSIWGHDRADCVLRLCADRVLQVLGT